MVRPERITIACEYPLTVRLRELWRARMSFGALEPFVAGEAST